VDTKRVRKCAKAHFELPKLNFLGSTGAVGFWPNENLATAAAEGATAPKLNLLGDAAVAVPGPGCESSCGFVAVASLAPPNVKLAAEMGFDGEAAAGELDTLGAAAAGPPQPLASGCFELPPGVLCGVTDAGLDGTLAATPGAVPPAWSQHLT
jgi:hypothetical protein